MSLPALHADIAARYSALNQAVSKGQIKPEQAAVLSDRYAWPVSKDGTLGMGQHASAERKYIDSVEASCPFIISTQEEDSDGDIVVARGADLSRFALNPVVLLGHGSYQMPIGTARAKDGTICVWPEENRVRAKCFFDMPDPDSAAVYGKVERGILNATSISFLPLHAHKREYDKAHHDGMMPPGWLFQRWQLTEFSIVSIPANAGAVRDWLDSDKDLSPKLQKALQPFAAVAKGRCFSGYCPCPPCEEKDWNESDHPRGQPDNAGQFGPGSGVPEKHRYKSHLGQFLHAHRVKDMTNKQNAAVLTSGLPGAKACHKSYCNCKSCKSGKTKKALPEQEDATSGSEAAGANQDRHDHEEEGADKSLQESVAAKMPKLTECGYTEPQCMALAAHLHGKGLEGEDITGHEEAAAALGYKKKDDMGGEGGEESMSLKSYVKSVKKESEEESLEDSEEGETESATEGEEADDSEEESPQYKPSAKWLGAMHNHMQKALDFTNHEIPITDHPQMAKAMTSHCKDMEGHMQNYKDLAGKYHPDVDFEKMCSSVAKEVEGGETEENENDTGANESNQASSEEESGRKGDDESPAEKVQEYQHPKGNRRGVQKSMMDHGCVKEAAEYMSDASRDATMPRMHKAAMAHHCSALTGYCKAMDEPPADPVEQGDSNEVPPEAIKMAAQRLDHLSELIFAKTGQRI